MTELQRRDDGGRKDDGGGLRISPRLILGLFALMVGILFILDNVGVLAAWDYVRYWPVALVLVGIVKVTQTHGNRLFGLLLILLGGWLLADELGYGDFEWEYVIPILLVVAGLNLLSSELFRRRRAARGPATDSEIDVVALLGGHKRASASQRFRGGTATAIMGGCEIDLRQAAIAEGEVAVIDTFAMWGGVEILVPETWEVVLKGFPVMGGFEDNTRHATGGSNQRLVVKGMAMMGGVEVKNHTRREAA